MEAEAEVLRVSLRVGGCPQQAVRAPGLQDPAQGSFGDPEYRKRRFCEAHAPEGLVDVVSLPA